MRRRSLLTASLAAGTAAVGGEAAANSAALDQNAGEASVRVSNGRDSPTPVRLELSRLTEDGTAETARIWVATVEPGDDAVVSEFVRSAGHYRLAARTEEDTASHGWVVDGRDDAVVVRVGRDGRVRIRDRRL